jgi:hypothetical protein
VVVWFVMLLDVRYNLRVGECSRWFNAFSFCGSGEKIGCFQNAQQTGNGTASYLLCGRTLSVPTGDVSILSVLTIWKS